MQLDWITVIAQIANFLVLVWILRRLLYGPVQRAMDRREAAILGRIANAEAREAAATAEAAALAAERAALAERRDGLIAETQDQARELLRDLEHAARAEVEEKRTAWWQQLGRERATFLRELRQQVAGYVDRVLRRALGDFAGKQLEDAMIDTFIARLGGLERDILNKFRAAAGAGDSRIEVFSALPLAPQARARLTRAIHQTIHADAEPAYGLDQTLVCGIRMKIRAETLQWSIDAYLDDLVEETAAYFDAATVTDDEMAAE